MFYYQIDDELKLILPTTHYAQELFELVRENLEQLKIWMPWATDDYRYKYAREFIERNLKEFAENGSFSAGVLLNDKLVGTCGFHDLNKANKSIQIGYWLAKSAQGKGLITRCCKVLINYAFDEMQLNRIQINCNTENLKSRAIPERLGFKQEGVHRQVEFLNGEFRDWAVYAMLAEDWKNL